MTNEQLCVLAKQGDADVQNLLIEKNLRFIKKTAHEVWSTQPELNCPLHIALDCILRCSAAADALASGRCAAGTAGCFNRRFSD